MTAEGNWNEQLLSRLDYYFLENIFDKMNFLKEKNI